MRKPIITILALWAFALLSSLSDARAASSALDPGKLEQAIQVFLQQDYRPADPRTTQISDGIGALVAQLPAAQFNDVIRDLLSDYARRGQADRELLEVLFESIQEQVGPELNKQAEYHPAFTVINDVLTVTTAFYSVKYGKAAIAKIAARNGRGAFAFNRAGWLSEQSPSAVQEVEKATAQAVSMLPEAQAKNLEKAARRIRLPGGLIAAGAGAAGGGVHVLMLSMQSQKMDPRKALRETQKQVVLDLGKQAASVLAQAKKLAAGTGAPPTPRINTLKKKIASLRATLLRFQSGTPSLKRWIEPAAQDLQAAEVELARALYREELNIFGDE